jgi:phage tail-like protein
MAYYPPVAFHFRVDFDLADASGNDILFREVSGIESGLTEKTVNEGGENRFVHKLPVRGQYPDLVLKRGLLKDSAVAQWCRDAIEDMDIEPITVTVSILNENHEPLETYNFINCWPKKWAISNLNAEQNEIVVETLTLAYQYWQNA